MYRSSTSTNKTSECNSDPNIIAMPEYQEWIQMIERCYNEDHPFFPHYGEIGITVVNDWLYSFSNFFSDLKQMPKDGNNYFLKRIDPTKPYQKGNCKWQKMQVKELHFVKYNTFMPSQERVACCSTPIVSREKTACSSLPIRYQEKAVCSSTPILYQERAACSAGPMFYQEKINYNITPPHSPQDSLLSSSYPCCKCCVIN